MKVFFYGLYGLGVHVLDRLIDEGHDVVRVVTKPDEETAQPVALRARELGIALTQPTSVRTAEYENIVKSSGADVGLVAGFNKIIPAGLLNVPRFGTLNIHGALLPKLRGPVPHKWAVLFGNVEHGVTAHLLTEGVDAGDILLQKSFAVSPEDDAEAVFQKSILASGEVAVEVLRQAATSEWRPVAQDEAHATHFGYPTEDDARFWFDQPAESIRRRHLAFGTRPGSWFVSHSRKIPVAACAVVQAQGRAGEVLDASPGRALVACREAAVSLEFHTDESIRQGDVLG